MNITSKMLAKLSAQAYKNQTISAGGTEVLIRQRGPIEVWAFRGTTFDGIDILKDLRAFPWWSKGANTFVHKGFFRGVGAIWPLLPLAIPNGKPIALTGHSKGGAEAILCGAFMASIGIPPVLIETFGAPRAGFSNIGKILKDIPGHRFRLGSDIVPTVPHAFPIPYRHDRDLTALEADDKHIFFNHRIADYVKAVL